MNKKARIAICFSFMAILSVMSTVQVYGINENSGTYSDSYDGEYTPDYYDTYSEEMYGMPEETASSKTEIVEADTGWFDPEHEKATYEISTEAELMGLAQLVNSRKMEWKVNEVYTFKDMTISLTDDIELTNNWIPIGNSDIHAFEGRFEGNGHTITNFNIPNATATNLGLFGYLKGSINNLNLSGQITAEGNNAGGLVGCMAPGSLIENCTTAVNITAENRIGGVVGINNCGTIVNCHNRGNIDGLVKVGGVVGENWGGTVSKSSNEGSVTSRGKGVGTYGTGGVVGRSVSQTAKVEECFNLGKINSVNECTGGVVGYSNSKGSAVKNNYNCGSIMLGGTQKEYGALGGVIGVVGIDGVTVVNNYNAGYLKGGRYVGGVIGEFIADYQGNIKNYISNNYYIEGTVKDGVGRVQGRSGRNYAGIVEARSSAELRSGRMPAILGTVYTTDVSDTYGQNSGYPVLSWQEENNTKREEILDLIKIKYKDELKKLYEKHPNGSVYANWVIEASNPKLLIEQALAEAEELAKQPEKEPAGEEAMF